MAQLAIQGHATRSKEVIQLLEMLGGINKFNLDGAETNRYYYIEDSKIYFCLSLNPQNCIGYTLEEFLEKFPYKVDDVVINHKYGKGYITHMLWISNEIVYEIKFEDCTAYCKANELCKYNAFKGLLLQELTEYLSHTTREELDKTMEEIEIALAPFKVGDKVIVKGYEKMGEDEIIYVFKTYDGDIKYKTKNHLDTHYFMEDSLTRVEKINKKENMEKRLEPVYELGTNKILYYEEKVSGERYCPIGETTLYIQEGYEFRDETNNVINAKKIKLTKKKPTYPKTYEECCEVLPKFKVGDKIVHKAYKESLFTITEITDTSYKGGYSEVLIEQQDNFELAPSKFDISILKPFDKVLVRDDNERCWNCELFDSYRRDMHYQFNGIAACYKQCIPYEGNEHLLGTINNCDDFYKTWE